MKIISSYYNNNFKNKLIWESNFIEVQTSQRKSERDSLKQDLGSEH